MKNIRYLLLGLVLFLTGCLDDTEPTSQDGGIADVFMGADARLDAGTRDVQIIEAGEGGYDFNLQGPTGGEIKYGSGYVMTDPVHVYLIWYGSWNNNTTVPIVEDFIIGLNGSPYFSLTSAYYELYPVDMIARTHAGVHGKIFATDRLIFSKSVFVDYVYGTTLNDDNIFDIVNYAIDNRGLPTDPTAIYLVLTSADVLQGGFGGFCGYYCGWHDHRVLNANDIKFGFIGDPGRCLDGCTPKRRYEEYGMTHSPNFNWSADGMVSVIGHELTETITDPDWDTYPGWMDDHSYENADKCAWNYGEIYSTDNQSAANVKLGTRDFLIQRNWALFADGGQGCALHP